LVVSLARVAGGRVWTRAPPPPPPPPTPHIPPAQSYPTSRSGGLRPEVDMRCRKIFGALAGADEDDAADPGAAMSSAAAVAVVSTAATVDAGAAVGASAAAAAGAADAGAATGVAACSHVSDRSLSEVDDDEILYEGE
jgi:hypothetical protein